MASSPPGATVVLAVAGSGQRRRHHEPGKIIQRAERSLGLVPLGLGGLAGLDLGSAFSAATCVRGGGVLGVGAGADVLAEEPAADPARAGVVASAALAALPAHLC